MLISGKAIGNKVSPPTIHGDWQQFVLVIAEYYYPVLLLLYCDFFPQVPILLYCVKNFQQNSAKLPCQTFMKKR